MLEWWAGAGRSKARHPRRGTTRQRWKAGRNQGSDGTGTEGTLERRKVALACLCAPHGASAMPICLSAEAELEPLNQGPHKLCHTLLIYRSLREARPRGQCQALTSATSAPAALWSRLLQRPGRRMQRRGLKICSQRCSPRGPPSGSGRRCPTGEDPRGKQQQQQQISSGSSGDLRLCCYLCVCCYLRACAAADAQRATAGLG